MTALRIGVLIATFRCVAPVRCGAFADERRIVAGEAGGRVWTRGISERGDKGLLSMPGS
jgi:hypothetical protein